MIKNVAGSFTAVNHSCGQQVLRSLTALATSLPADFENVGGTGHHDPMSNESVEHEPLLGGTRMDKLRRQFGHLPAWAQPSALVTATAEELAARRRWLVDGLARLSEAERTAIEPRLFSERHHAQALAELAAGAVLENNGYRVEHERGFGARTPDVYADRSGAGSLVLEVWTRAISRQDAAHLRAWGELAARVNQIERPVLIAVDAADRSADEAPAPEEQVQVATTLRRWLNTNAYIAARSIEISGYRFFAMEDMPGNRAELRPVRPSAYADSRHVWDAVSEKTARYRRVVNEFHLSMVVVLSSEPRAGLDRSMVENALSGRNTVSMAFDFATFGSMKARSVQIRQTDAAPMLDPLLSAMAWIEVGNDEPHLTVWPNEGAEYPVPLTESPSITIAGV